MRHVATTVIISIIVAAAAADVVHLKTGGAHRGTVIQESDELVTLALQYGTVKIKRADIESIERTGPEEAQPDEDGVVAVKEDMRLPRWSRLIGSLAKSPWATGLTQIPATVIDKGVMRSVPYTSYRCGSGGNYEVNVYGDPDAPAGVEIGVYGALTRDATAKQRCIEFIASVLPDATDAAILKAARPEEDKIERGGMTIEITPPTAEDAYGGWWVSVYYEQRLDQARASEKELKAITVAQDEPVKPSAGKAPVAQSPTGPSASNSDLGWSGDELKKARRPQVSTSSSSSGGRVYVRGYYRKDGTYVRGHTRSRSGRR